MLSSYKFYGTTGFVPTTQQLRETLKPGTALGTQDHFYESMAHSSAYKSATPYSSLEYAGLLSPCHRIPQSSFRSTQQLMQSESKQRDYIVPDRRGIMANQPERVLPNKPFTAVSMHKADFPNHSEQLNDVLSHTYDEYIAAFDEMDSGKRGYLELSQAPTLLSTVFGRSPSGKEVDEFTFPFRDAKQKLILREAFVQSLPIFTKRLVSETNTRLKKYDCPEWNRKRDCGRLVIGQPMESSYHRDFGRFGSNPSDRAFTTEYGILSTTDELNLGTVKHSKKISGYSGHLPQALNATVACEHGNEIAGQQAVVNDLRLTYNHNKQGYQGFRPADPFNDHGSRNVKPELTTTGEALNRALRIWENSDMKTTQFSASELWHRPSVV